LDRIVSGLLIFTCFILLVCSVCDAAPSSSNIIQLTKEKLAKWKSIHYTMDMDIGGLPYGYRVYYKRPSNLTTISWNKNDSNDKVTMIVFKNTTTVFDHKQKKKQTFDTGAFDLFRINNEYDKNWTVEYLGDYNLPYVNKGKKEKRACWVVAFTTQQGVTYRFWIDQYVGITMRMEVKLKKHDEKPYVIAKTTFFKVDAPVDASIFKDPF
jgi:outer membrane lipoprotein-sorting protein